MGLSMKLNLFQEKNKNLTTLLIVIFLIKLIILAILGPGIFPDTGLYLSLANDALLDSSWLHDGQWDSYIAPGRLLRPWGYPLLIAASRLLVGDRFEWLLAICQIVFSVAALAGVTAIGRHLIFDRRLLMAAQLLCATSGFLLFDIVILTDSFYSSLFIAVFVMTGLMILGEWKASPAAALVLGILWALSMSLRDVAIYHAVLPLAGLILAIRRQGLGAWHGTAVLAAFLAPIVGMATLVTAWNLHRTGYAFYSITGGINWLWPNYNIADRGLADPFDCADEICRMGRKVGPLHGMAGVSAIADGFWNEQRMDPLSFCRLTRDHLLALLKSHPLPFLLSVLSNLQISHLADLAFNPLSNLNELFKLHSATGHRLFPATREIWPMLRAGEWAALPLLMLNIIPAAFAMTAMAITVIAAPLRAIRRLGQSQDSARAEVVLFFFASAVLFVGSYCLVHMEMRHAMPAAPLIVLTFAATLDDWLKKTKSSGSSA
jgi:hypothetical protein